MFFKAGRDSVQDKGYRLKNKKLEEQKQPAENKNKGFVAASTKKITYINIYLAKT